MERAALDANPTSMLEFLQGMLDQVHLLHFLLCMYQLQGLRAHKCHALQMLVLIEN